MASSEQVPAASSAAVPSDPQEASAGADSRSIRSWQLIRLKSPPTRTIILADDFIKDLDLSPLIQTKTVLDATLSLYGYAHAGKKPGFAAFLSVFDELALPTIPSYAYVMIIRPSDQSSPWYAMPFGFGGKGLLDEDCLDVDAARKLAVALTTPKDRTKSPRIKQISTTQVGSRPIRVLKRATGDAALEDFLSDKRSEILNEIHAKPEDKGKYGSSVRGGDGIGLNKPLAIEQLCENIIAFESIHVAVASDNGKDDWMHAVGDVPLIRALDDALVAAVRDQHDETVTFSIPDFIHENSAPVKISLVGRTRPLTDDFDMPTYRDLLRKAGQLDTLTLDYLKDARLTVGEQIKKSFRIYNCLSAEIQLHGKTYIHDNNNWVHVPADTIDYINSQVDGIAKWPGGLAVPTQRVQEGTYNKQADLDRFLVLDARNKNVAKGEKPIEICDLLAIDDDDYLALVHVKRDFKSSMLSHLFAQARGSALMMLETAPRGRFRDRINETMKERSKKPRWSRKLQGFISDDGFNPRRTRIVFAILAPWNQRVASKAMPFMSKLNLSNTARELRGRQFDIRLEPIEMEAAQHSTKGATV